MKFVKKVVKELLQIRGIKKPKALFGRKKYQALMDFADNYGTGVCLSTIKMVAKMLNVPPSFIVRMYFYGRIYDETIN